jgi:hypothetical protein
LRCTVVDALCVITENMEEVKVPVSMYVKSYTALLLLMAALVT